MKNIVDGWDNFIDEILRNFRQYLKEPLFYAMVALVLVIFFALYNLPRNRKHMRRSIIGLADYAAKLILGFIGDILTAIESFTNFIDVVRIVLAGRLTEATQFLLGNYAIVALSVASFATTYNGITRITPWYMAALITFGIQVGILSLSSKLAVELGKKRKQSFIFHREVIYSSTEEDINDVLKKRQRVTNNKSNGTTSWMENLLNQSTTAENQVFRPWYIISLCLLLCFSMCTSIYFSYIYLFDLLISPSVPLENYITVIETVTEVTESNSNSIQEYQNILLSNLMFMNAEIRKGLQPYIENIETENNIISDYKGLIDELQEDISTIQEEKSENEKLQAQAEDEGNNAEATKNESWVQYYNDLITKKMKK